MPYWSIPEKRFDKNGKEVLPGHILRDPNGGPWEYFVCFTHDGKLIEVIDLNANNVCMCDLGPEGNVEVLGHISDVYKALGEYWDSDDWGYYFSILAPEAEGNDYYHIKELDQESVKRIHTWNNFPRNWRIKI